MTTDKTVEAVEALSKLATALEDMEAVEIYEVEYTATLARDLRLALSELTRLQEEVKGLAGFAKVALDALWYGSDLDGGDIQAAALQHGLIVQTTFDPNIHSDHLGVGVYPGDEWFVPAPWLATLQGQQS